ncbi:site-specific DNA-methyltransferase [Pelotomaculum terephthalicicum JT]|uniref:site-specific DNA-methyltransferase n=1 Tax=Pelotomaculum terephthalicicum TaxID=206393 RepID=UPI0009C9F5C3|nr:site-specific DNA-methyltransferase [Pelotomaculum terephthalicicum]MCG9969484.1 site-specific DNA-methyltransferase [Pelotomaculum terephthalicicum JT]OPX92621.1 MAG: putative methyltransferase [Pelotomaculum sp. PtaB.Bin104]
MDNMRFESANLTAANIEKIAELFPGVVTEGKVNFDLLRSLLGDEVYGDEAYEFTWVGKRAAIAEAGRPIRKTLRPCVEESKNWDTTENLYIEGDNLDVLKLLQESYLGKVKMIYIDPPYNTGNDFIYRDNFMRNKDEYDEEAGVYDENGDRLFRNTESNGRFHSDWCSMMYPRLVLARNLLRDDGVIFISIDDNEVAQLRKICDEVFGESNFIAQLIWERAYAPKNDAKYISNSHDYVLIYAKSIDSFQIGRLPRTEEANARYSNPDNDPRGVWKPSDMSVKTYNAACDYPITTPSGRVIEPPAGRCWSLSKNAFFERLQDNRIWFGTDGNSVPSIKRFLSELRFDGMAPTSILFYKEVGHSQEGAKEVVALFDGKGHFDGPKPVRLLRRLLTLANTEEDSIILDFFSGSATTAHAVMQLNAEDGGKRKFIMVQLAEPCAPDSEAAKAGFKNICEIGKERIRRAGEKINSELRIRNAESNKQEQIDSDNSELRIPNSEFKLDIGFRVLKLDDTNMKDVYYAASEYTQDLLSMMEDNIKDDRTDMDLLYACLLDWGLPLSMPHTQEKIGGFTVHTYNDGDLIACFDKHISDEVVKEIARRQPLRAVFRDSSFASSPEKINVEEIFKLLAPNTSVRVI